MLTTEINIHNRTPTYMFDSQERKYFFHKKYFRHIKIGFERIVKIGWKSLLDNNTPLKAIRGLL